MGLLQSLKSTLLSGDSSRGDKSFSSLESTLGYSFRNKGLLREALTHPSFDTRKKDHRHNQRLEFLGDSLVGCVLANWLFQKFPEKTEGELSRFKSLLARGHNLATVARKINLNEYLIIGKSERQSKGNFRQSVLEDAFEALIGAIYLDSDYFTIEKVMLQWEPIFIEALEEKSSNFNPKGQLQEYLQSKSKSQNFLSCNQTIGSGSPEEFFIEIHVDGQPIAEGHGKSKKTPKKKLRKLLEKLKATSRKKIELPALWVPCMYPTARPRRLFALFVNYWRGHKQPLGLGSENHSPTQKTSARI